MFTRILNALVDYFKTPTTPQTVVIEPELTPVDNTPVSTPSAQPLPKADTFNLQAFFSEYNKHFGKLTTVPFKGLDYILSRFKWDGRDDFLYKYGTVLGCYVSLAQLAYILATIKHETANKFTPINEYGKGKGRAYGRKHKLTGQIYYGRGYVQLTHYDNYKFQGEQFGIDLVNNPSLALESNISLDICVVGMIHGQFTGKKLAHFINGGPKKDYVGARRVVNGTDKDYVGARRVVNGTDKAKLIAGYAEKFELCLKARLGE